MTSVKFFLLKILPHIYYNIESLTSKIYSWFSRFSYKKHASNLDQNADKWLRVDCCNCLKRPLLHHKSITVLHNTKWLSPFVWKYLLALQRLSSRASTVLTQQWRISNHTHFVLL